MSQFALVLIAGAFGAMQALTDSAPAAGEPVWKTKPKAEKAARGWEERGALGAADVRAEVHHPPTPLRGSTAAIWVACGVVVGPGYRPPAVEFDETDARRHVSAVSHARGTIAWRYVATNPRYADDARFAVVNCRDGPFGGSKDDQDTSKAGACACKSAAWFAKALWLFPAARFIAKTEDDTLVHDARLVAELRWAWSRESRAESLWCGWACSNGALSSRRAAATAGTARMATGCCRSAVPRGGTAARSTSPPRSGYYLPTAPRPRPSHTQFTLGGCAIRLRRAVLRCARAL